MIQLKIDPEFRDKIPRPTDEEVEQLEKNILRDGRITDPIFTWHGFIVDGHTRYGIMQKHPDVDFKPTVEALDDMFSEKDEVIVWMCERQTGRRNITNQVKKMLAEIAYEAICRLKGTNRYTNKDVEDPTRSAKKPAEQIADQFNMSVPHVKHAVRFGRGVREIEKQAPGATEELMAGKSKVPDATIESFPSASEDEKQEIISALKEGRAIKKEKTPRPMSPQMKDFTKKMLDVVAEMENEDKAYGIEDAIHDMESAEDVFFTQLRFVLDERKNIVFANDESREMVIGFINSFITALNELKGEI